MSCNPRFCMESGHTKAQLLGLSVFSLVHKDDLHLAYRFLSQSVVSGSTSDNSNDTKNSSNCGHGNQQNGVDRRDPARCCSPPAPTSSYRASRAGQRLSLTLVRCDQSGISKGIIVSFSR